MGAARRAGEHEAMLRSYLPALVFVALGFGLGGLFVLANLLVGPRGRGRKAVREQPYESGIPSDFRRGTRFGISFYLVGLMFLIFDLEVLLLLPTAMVLKELGWHALGAIGLFMALLGIAFLYEWRRGALDWRD
jgi:NADH-quinone oxidoreductase subunit A